MAWVWRRRLSRHIAGTDPKWRGLKALVHEMYQLVDFVAGTSPKCPLWLTSTDDLPALKSFYARAVRLKQRAVQIGNQLVVEQQEHIIPLLAVRIKSLEEPEMDGALCVDNLLIQLRADLVEAESGLEETREAGLLVATKTLEWTTTELKARIGALEGAE